MSKKLLYGITTLAIVLLLFNIYHFFIRAGVGPRYYIDHLRSKHRDRILESKTYQDYVEEYYLLNKQLSDKKVIVFLGNSITKGFNVHEFLPGYPVINRGIYFDTTWGIINRLEKNVNNLHVEMLFLMIGYNDLKYRTDRDIVENISHILSAITAEKTYMQSILPVQSDWVELNKRIINLNEDIKQVCLDHHIEYIDLHSHFIGGKVGLSTQYTRDGVHLNYQGYILWSKIVLPLISRVMDEALINFQ